MTLAELIATALPDLPDDYAPALQAVIAGIFVLGGGVLTAVIAWLTRLSVRLRRMETRDRLSWLYIRSLIDYAYRHSDTTKYPLPEPPDGLLDPAKE